MRHLIFSAAALMTIAGQAFAADLPSKQAPAVFTVSPGFTWSGFYTGVNVGGIGAFGSNTYGRTDPTGATASGSAGDSATGAGLAGGLQLGYNYQLQNIVLGLEADYAFASAKASASTSSLPLSSAALAYSAGGATTTIGSLGTGRGRAGFTTGSTLFYATGGVAYSYVKSSALFNQGGAPFTFPGSNANKVGWVVGGGVEQAVADHVTIKAEVLYADLGTVSGSNSFNATNSFTYQTKVTAVVGRIGMNIKFGTDPAPVVAKY